MCKLVTLPGLCAITNETAPIYMQCRNPMMPSYILSFDWFVLLSEINSADVKVPYGLFALAASLPGTPPTSDEVTPLVALIRQLNATYETFWPLNNVNGPWRAIRSNITNATMPSDDYGINTSPNAIVFDRSSHAISYTTDNEGAVLGIVDISYLDVDSPNPRIEYTIRLNNSATPSTVNGMPDGFSRPPEAARACEYAKSGFLAVQTALDDAFAKILTARKAANNASVAAIPMSTDPLPPILGATVPMPVGPRYNSIALIVMSALASLLFMLGYLYQVQQSCVSLVAEKENGTKEAALVMGLRRSALYASHFTIVFTIAILTAVLSAIAFTFWLLTTITFWGMFILLLGFSLGVSTLAFLLSTFFGRARIASLASPMLYIAVVMYTAFVADTAVGGVITAPFVTAPLSAVMNLMLTAAQHRGAVSFATFISEPLVIRKIIHLYVLSIFYFVLGAYLDHVLPSASGAPLHPLFFVMPSYWFGGSNSSTPPSKSRAAANPLVEPLTAAQMQRISVDINGLVKVFKTETGELRAVDGLTLSVLEGHITILLGHNGAGKTTTVSMLTGLLPVTGGDAIVYGNSIVTNMTAVRGSLGLCPQKNVIWPDLTVRRHLDFYAAVKGVDGAKRADAVQTLAVRLGLADKIDALAGGLSGGQKRKLCVAMALIGGSKVVYLDEPTAGMDVQARLAMWEMLQEVKKDRTVIMSTHYMDEAEQLGDRVALMSHGKLHSCGTPLFLKQRLGVGYHLAVSMVEPESTAAPASPTAARGTTTMGVSDEAAAQSAAGRVLVEQRKAALVALVMSFMPTAEVVSDVGGELSMRLPMDGVSTFGTLFDKMDADKDAMGIRSYIVSPTTMEEVFLKVAAAEPTGPHGCGASPTTKPGEGGFNAHGAAEVDLSPTKGTQPSLSRGNPDASRAAQFIPLLTKRIHVSRRDKKLICMTILMPLIFCLICAAALQLGPPKLPSLDVWPLPDSEVVVAGSGLLGAAPEAVSDSFPFSTEPFNVQTFVAPSDVRNTSALSKYLDATYNLHEKQRHAAVVFGDTFYSPNGTFTQVPAVYLLNATSYHAAPMAVSYRHNYIINGSLGGTLREPATLTRNHPLPRSKAFNKAVSQATQFLTGMILVAPFLILPAVYGAQTVKERETKAKHLQYISGAYSPIYWITFAIVDYVLYVLSSSVAVATFLICNVIGIKFAYAYVHDAGALVATIVILAVYGLCAIPCTYVLGFLFASHSTASSVMATAGVMIGFMLNFGVLVLSMTVSWWRPIDIICRIVPHFNLGNALIRMSIAAVADEDASLWRFHEYGILEPLVALVVSIFIWWGLLLACETGITAQVSGWFNRSANKLAAGVDGATIALPPADEDTDVAAERDLVKSNARSGDRLRVVDMVKVFTGVGQKTKVAVAGVTFGVKRDEVFAFLGTNGAGKTTTISILGGEFEPTYGHGYVDGYDVVSERDMARRNMGYCPQFDAVLDNMNSDEHLQLYGSLRGLDSAAIARDTETLIATLGLQPHRYKTAGSLSGGNKRKLSIALALIGAPAVIFLDEPSAGLDPVARRALWDALGSFTRGCSVVLTTHHLEEVEALAQRVGIMVDGRLVCMGPLSHLKNKFGKGYEVQLSCRSDDESAACAQALIDRYADAAVVAVDGSRRTVEVPAGSATLGGLFRAVEGLKLQHPSLDFSVGQTSLEQVFVRVSKETEETAAAAELGGGPPRKGKGGGAAKGAAAPRAGGAAAPVPQRPRSIQPPVLSAAARGLASPTRSGSPIPQRPMSPTRPGPGGPAYPRSPTHPYGDRRPQGQPPVVQRIQPQPHSRETSPRRSGAQFPPASPFRTTSPAPGQLQYPQSPQRTMPYVPASPYSSPHGQPPRAASPRGTYPRPPAPIGSTGWAGRADPQPHPYQQQQHQQHQQHDIVNLQYGRGAAPLPATRANVGAGAVFNPAELLR